MPLSTSLFPLFSKLDGGENERLKRLYIKSIRYSALLTLPVITAIIATATPLTRSILQSRFGDSAFYLQLLMFDFAFSAMLGGSTLNSFLQGQRHTETMLRSSVLRAASGIALGALLIPQHGVIGLIVSQFVSTKLALVYSQLWIRRSLHFRFNPVDNIRIIVSSGAGLSAGYLLVASINTHRWLEVILGGTVTLLIYYLSLVTLKAISAEDLDEIQSLTRSLGPLVPYIDAVFSITKRLVKLRG